MIDCLVSADVSVTDADAIALLFVEKLGLPNWRDNWIHNWATRRYKAYFLRPQLNRSIAPTAIEVIGPHPELGYGGWQPALRGVHELQGTRPMKTHNTVFSVADPEEYLKRLRDAHVPYLYDPGSGELVFSKLWVGREAGDEFAYNPVFDAGLFIEIVPTSAMRLGPDALEPLSEPGVEPGKVVRVASRSFIVDDLDLTVRTLKQTFGWEPANVGRSLIDACRIATYSGSLPGSAALELLQPDDPSTRVGAHRREHGAGAYRITFAVNGIAEAASRLRDRGVLYDVDEPRGSEKTRLRINPASVGGLVIDFIEF